MPAESNPADDACPTSGNHSAYILKDEHTTFGCLINDVVGDRLTLTTPDAERVPSVFVLYAPHMRKTVVCWAVWRGDETITAAFHSPVG
jgi:hypothetical protein